MGEVCGVTANTKGTWWLTCHRNNEFCHFPCCASATAHSYSLYIHGIYTHTQCTPGEKQYNLCPVWPDQRLCLLPEKSIIPKFQYFKDGFVLIYLHIIKKYLEALNILLKGFLLKNTVKISFMLAGKVMLKYFFKLLYMIIEIWNRCVDIFGQKCICDLLYFGRKHI